MTSDGPASQVRPDSELRRRIGVAVEAVSAAMSGTDAGAVTDAQADLTAAVQAANADGMSWQSIGDVLGVRRGAAYQRHRRRSAIPGDPRADRSPAL